jgi:Tfp pilus assembly protein PilV
MRARKYHRGFILMETLVGLTLLAIGLAVFAEACRYQHDAFERAAEMEKRAALLATKNLQQTLHVSITPMDK